MVAQQWCQKVQATAEADYRQQMDLVDKWQATTLGSDDYYELGTEVVATP